MSAQLGELLLADKDAHDLTLKGRDGVEVTANRYALAVRSPVFKAMLLGKFTEGSRDAILIEEYNGSILRAVVEFIHTDDPQMLKTKEGKATSNDDCLAETEQTQRLVSLSAAAQYFDLPDLVMKVKEYISTMLKESPAMAFVLLEVCNQQGPAIPENLVNLAWRHVRSSGKNVEKAVACMNQNTLEGILKDDKMEMNEFELFKMLLLWVESSPSDRKLVAKNMVHLIRLDAINPDNLSSTVMSSGLVTQNQLSEAYRKQAMHAQKKHCISFQEPRQPKRASSFVWSKTLSKDFTKVIDGETVGLLHCPPMTSGVHKWILKLVGPRAETVGFGLASKGVSLDLQGDLEQKGTWCFYYGETYSEGKNISGSRYDWAVAANEEVTLTLDLRPNQHGNGTLRGTIQRKDGTAVEAGLIKNLLEHLKDNPTGFVPAVETFQGSGFRLVSFQKMDH